MLHYKTQLYILGEHCSERREMASRKAKLSRGRSAFLVVTLLWSPPGCSQDPEGLDVAFWRDRVRRGYHHCRHPNAALLPAAGTSGLVLRSPVQEASAVVTGSSFRDTRSEKSFIP